MRNQSKILGLSPEPWVGVNVGFHVEFNTKFKQLVSMSAWDPLSKTRWFPHSNTVLVSQLVRELKLATDSQLDACKHVIEESLKTQHVRTDETLAGDYAALGLHPSCSRTLVEWAIILARKELGNFTAPTTRLLELEECYRRIVAAGMQPPAPAPVEKMRLP